VLDPYGRLPSARQVFTDGAAPTLVVRAADAPDARVRRFGDAEILAVSVHNGRIDLSALLEALRDRGLYVLFVEGGGATVSAFVRAGLLDRLQIAVAPLIIGDGRPGVRLPASAKLRDCLRPVCRLYRMGDDALFDDGNLRAGTVFEYMVHARGVGFLDGEALVLAQAYANARRDGDAVVASYLLGSFRFDVRSELLEPGLVTGMLLSAHLIIFWLSQDSNVTPPVCLVAFAAAAIAGTRPMRTGLTAWKVAKGLYLVPLLFAFSPLITGD